MGHLGKVSLLIVFLISCLTGLAALFINMQKISDVKMETEKNSYGILPVNTMKQDTLYDMARKNILVLNSYHADMLWVQSEEKGIRSILGNDTKIRLYFDYMDTKRNISTEYMEKFYELYLEKCKNTHFDAVIVTDDAAYRFVLEHQQELFPDIPIVFCGINFFENREIQRNPWVTGVAEVTDMKRTVDAALELHPNVKKIVFINDESDAGKVNHQLLLKIMPEFIDRVEFTLFEKMTMPALLKKVSALDNDSLIILMTFNVDEDQKIFSYEESADLIAAKSKVPIYCTWDFYLGHGVVGGMMTSGYTQGEKAAQLMQKILYEGRFPADIPFVLESINHYMFDYNEMKKFGIQQSMLPAGSIVVNKPVTFYETYKNLVWAVATVVLVLLFMVIVLVMNIRYRRRGEEEIRQLNAALESRVLARTHDLQETNNKLTATLVDLKQMRTHLIEAEKMASLGELVAGVAHEINTPVGNSITAISHLETNNSDFDNKFSMGTMKKSDLENYLAVVHSVVKIVFTNLTRAAELIRSFKKVAVDQSLEERRIFCLDEYMNDILISLKPQLKKTRHKMIFHCPADITVYWDPGALWQIMANLLSNSLLHAYEEDSEGIIAIDVYKDGEYILIKYADDGKGMPPEVQKKIFEPFFTTKRGSGGSGLGMNIVYNLVVFKMNGTIECNSNLEVGTEFIIRIRNTEQDKG
ncbi:ABC transporter substrate binding protein [Propionispira arboris]|uniref:histidine kinase n=1 Tax=Propionispira arboris TaxID=84035 RepID=A0A1H7CAN3_9FIRM|nr:sensor histidine kinase [Propionispira arboris]SEJ82705.1 ABC transporter substrate binding protein [Propionispira arboris]